MEKARSVRGMGTSFLVIEQTLITMHMWMHTAAGSPKSHKQMPPIRKSRGGKSENTSVQNDTNKTKTSYVTT